jgi:hypothetical protein
MDVVFSETKIHATDHQTTTPEHLPVALLETEQRVLPI